MTCEESPPLSGPEFEWNLTIPVPAVPLKSAGRPKNEKGVRDFL